MFSTRAGDPGLSPHAQLGFHFHNSEHPSSRLFLCPPCAHPSQVYSQHGSLCALTACPLHAGPASLLAEWVLPRLAPPGPYTVQLKATTNSNFLIRAANDAADATAASSTAAQQQATPAGHPQRKLQVQHGPLGNSQPGPGALASQQAQSANDYAVFCVNVFFDLP